MAKKKPFQKHFRKFKNGQLTGHPQYVYGDDGKCYEVLGITSAPETNGVLNVKLKANPEPNNSSPAYVRTKPAKVDKGVRNKKLKGWKLSNADKPVVNEIIANAEKKPRKKAGHKKERSGNR